MKRFLLKLSVLALVVVGCLVLATACETTHVHTFSEEWTIDIEPTCVQEGSQSHHCTGCSEKKDSTVLPKTDHSYGAWTATSCSIGSSKKRICSVCNAEETEILSAEHLFNQNGLCTVCKHFDETKVVTEGLVFEYSTDYDGYICRGFDKNAFKNETEYRYYLSEKK